MARTCGKENCRCQTGDKHVSLYVSTLVGKTRKMIYVPPDLETQVREGARKGRKAKSVMPDMTNHARITLRLPCGFHSPRRPIHW